MMPRDLRDALADAQSAVGSFFVDGAGSEFADEADLQSVAGGLRSDEGAAQGLEGALCRCPRCCRWLLLGLQSRAL